MSSNKPSQPPSNASKQGPVDYLALINGVDQAAKNPKRDELQKIMSGAYASVSAGPTRYEPPKEEEKKAAAPKFVPRHLQTGGNNNAQKKGNGNARRMFPGAQKAPKSKTPTSEDDNPADAKSPQSSSAKEGRKDRKDLRYWAEKKVNIVREPQPLRGRELKKDLKDKDKQWKDQVAKLQSSRGPVVFGDDDDFWSQDYNAKRHTPDLSAWRRSGYPQKIEELFIKHLLRNGEPMEKPAFSTDTIEPGDEEFSREATVSADEVGQNSDLASSDEDDFLEEDEELALQALQSSKPKKRKALQMLEKHGWKQGEGLGKDGEGMAKPLSVQTGKTKKSKNAAFGPGIAKIKGGPVNQGSNDSSISKVVAIAGFIDFFEKMKNRVITAEEMLEEGDDEDIANEPVEVTVIKKIDASVKRFGIIERIIARDGVDFVLVVFQEELAALNCFNRINEGEEVAGVKTTASFYDYKKYEAADY